MKSLGQPCSMIDGQIAAFNKDEETALAESTIHELIATYPDNHTVQHVLVKVIAINSLYHARVLDVDLQPLAIHITKLDLDEKLKAGNPKAVDLIWKSEGTRRHYFSFATKFCSWHNEGAYAMYDRYMWAALVAYKAKKQQFTFKTGECSDYAGFLGVVKRFQESCGLGDYSLKDIDKFLWLVGGRIIADREAAAPVDTKAV